MIDKKYAIICNARNKKGIENYNIQKLALVDRRKTKSLFWTSDDSTLIMKFNTLNGAKIALSKLKYNSPKIVEFSEAARIINNNSYSYEAKRNEMESYVSYYGDELGWDAHKSM